MTKEEAIEEVRDAFDIWESEYDTGNDWSKEHTARDMAIKALEQEPRKGEWLRMSYLTEQDDDRYKCSRCGNVVHYKHKVNLYTFNGWCGRCGSNNGREIEKIKSLPTADVVEQEPCEMTAEEYRQRLMQAFRNADCDELVAVCVLPTEKEFEHLEWLLKNHYKQEPCEDAVSRKAVIETIFKQGSAEELEIDFAKLLLLRRAINTLPHVTPVACIATVKFSKEDLQELIDEKVKNIVVESNNEKWIPVSEGLPKEDGDYFVTVSTDIGAKKPVREVCKDYFCEFEEKWLNYGEYVTAWQPLPKPYKTDIRESEN